MQKACSSLGTRAMGQHGLCGAAPALECHVINLLLLLLLQVESGRYHVYVGNACPWCHRVLLVLALTGQQCIGYPGGGGG